jgi:proteasome beta subunit
LVDKKVYKTGTTTVGIITKEAIVLASDMKGTMGNLAVSTDATKIYAINNNLALTFAGSQADAQNLIRYLQNHANLYELEHKKELSTKSCVTLLSNVLNANRGFPYYTQFIVGGTDLKLYTLDVVGGFTTETKYACTGSGTELALSVLDNNYKSNVSLKDAIILAKHAVSAAKKRDIYSGGEGIRIVIISKNGIEELPIKKFIE